MGTPVRGINRDADGRVDIWSAPGVGTTVTLRLPTELASCETVERPARTPN